ncbi:MAG: hypothetical protein JWP44_4307 [Mucilaginibacter sp.]|nr:hypothetical protein [Mucilaginibacter sp.]
MRLITIFMLIVSMLNAPIRQDTIPKEILLWPNGAPGSAGRNLKENVRMVDGEHIVSDINSPAIIPYIPTTNIVTHVAVIIVPGGGHKELWMDHEGYSPAHWFREHGIAAFILKYRLALGKNSAYTIDRDELADMQRAIRLVRSRAKEWNIDPSKVGVIGFSAGGELAGLAGMHFTKVNPEVKDPVDQQSDRPDFQGVIYPGNNERLEVSKDSPPVFIAGGYKDAPAISEGIATLYLKYKKAAIPAELHIYAAAPHGFGIRKTNTGAVTAWPEEFRLWLLDLGILK